MHIRIPQSKTVSELTVIDFLFDSRIVFEVLSSPASAFYIYLCSWQFLPLSLTMLLIGSNSTCLCSVAILRNQRDLPINKNWRLLARNVACDLDQTGSCAVVVLKCKAELRAHIRYFLIFVYHLSRLLSQDSRILFDFLVLKWLQSFWSCTCVQAIGETLSNWSEKRSKPPKQKHWSNIQLA